MGLDWGLSQPTYSINKTAIYILARIDLVSLHGNHIELRVREKRVTLNNLRW